MKRRIDFVIVGAQKAGTTALHEFLQAHPTISMPPTKEMHFFNRRSWMDFHLPVWRSRKRRLYHRRFPHFPSPEYIYGEATPHYMTWNVALDRIQHYNPSIRVIAVLRHPVERAFSHWNMERQRQLIEQTTFEDAVAQELNSATPIGGRLDEVRSFIQRGFYAPQIQALWDRFGKERVLVIKHDALLQKHDRTLSAVHKFLGIPTIAIAPRRVHDRPYSTEMSPATREQLLATYAEDVSMVERMTGWDCTDWKV